MVANKGGGGFQTHAESWKYYIKNDGRIRECNGFIDDRIRKLKSELEAYEIVGRDMPPEQLPSDSKLLGIKKNLEEELKNLTQTYDEKELLREGFIKKNDSSSFDHYLSTLEPLLSYVSGSEVEGKEFYNDLIRAQISNDEIYLIYFALIGNDEYSDLKKLCTEARLFKKLTVDDFYYGEKHMRYYAKQAFGLSGEWS